MTTETPPANGHIVLVSTPDHHGKEGDKVGYIVAEESGAKAVKIVENFTHSEDHVRDLGVISGPTLNDARLQPGRARKL